jgi:hypothetical protein
MAQYDHERKGSKMFTKGTKPEHGNQNFLSKTYGKETRRDTNKIDLLLLQSIHLLKQRSLFIGSVFTFPINEHVFSRMGVTASVIPVYKNINLKKVYEGFDGVLLSKHTKREFKDFRLTLH